MNNNINNNINNEYYKYKKTRKRIIFDTIDINNDEINDKKTIAIIIPHRDRLEHLKMFIEKINKLNIYENIMDVYVIDQNNGDSFNRGLLLNIGYLISKKFKKYDRYIFHDVDSYPDQDLMTLYFQSTDKNIHFASPYLGYKYTFDTFFGGVNGFNQESIDKINGYCNTRFSWGGEDDMLYNRCVINNIKVFRPKKGHYELPYHDPPEQIDDLEKKKSIMKDLKNWKNDGLNQLKNYFINIKEYVYDNFISTYNKENSNITNNSIEFDKYNNNNDNNNNKINYYFFKIDYLAKHTFNDSYYLSKNYIIEHINKKINEFKKNGIKYFQHPKDPSYISIIEPLIYWNEIYDKIINTYTEPLKYESNKIENNKLSKKQITIKNLVNKSFDKLSDYNFKGQYKHLSKNDLEQTIKYIFDTFNELIYFRIRNNKIVCSYHLYNPKNNVDWYKNLTYKQQNIDKANSNIMKERKKPYYTLRKPHFIPANNCLLGFDAYNYFEGNPTSYIKEFIEMLEYTCILFKNVPDCDILINRKDFAYLQSDNYYPYTHVVSEKSNYDGKYWMIGTQSIKNINLDIPIPSSDEWKDIDKYKDIDIKWKNKKNIAFFRGSTTGCGSNINNNPRLKLCNISYLWNNDNDKKNLIDVKISKIVSRITAHNKIIELNEYKNLKHLVGDFIDTIEQIKYKYIFNIEGNAQAYRYGNEFKKNSLLLNVASEYSLWFEPLLIENKHYIKIDNNYDNLYETMIYINNNDKKMENISNNGCKFSNKYITKKSISIYWFFYMYYSNKLQSNNLIM
jgi:hypothetical protein